MFITKQVVKRGKVIPVEQLKPSSSIKVDVKCPECGMVRSVTYRSVVAAGHHVCLKCMRKRDRIDLLVGSRFGWLVVKGASSRGGRSVCVCDCGKECEVENSNLKAGQTTSCGCKRSLNFINAEAPTGENHGRWKGGVSSERERFSSLKIHKDWRIAVLERDGHTCRKCSARDSLHVHHIIEFSAADCKRISPDNGITLCPDCHRAFHAKYGRKGNTKEQIDEFITP